MAPEQLPFTEGATGTPVASLVWQALRGLTHPAAHSDQFHADADPPLTDELIEQLPNLWEAVWQAAQGEAPDLGAIPSSMPVRRLLDEVRRAFLDLARGCGTAVDSREMIRVLAALDGVQRAHDRAVREQFTDKLSAPSGLDLVVEVAHDMRSPLTSILFLVEMMRKGQSGPLTPLQERQLGLVWSAAFGLGSVVTDIVDLVRAHRLMDPRPVPFSLAEVIDSVRDIVQPIAEEKGLTLDVILPDQCSRRGHPTAIHRVLLNLTTNALKFAHQGAVVLAGRQIAPDRVELSVRDSGRGIPPSVLSRLFDPFRTQGRGEWTFSSAGLGLEICRKVVSAMGSELRVQTQEGVGTQFLFALDLPAIVQE